MEYSRLYIQIIGVEKYFKTVDEFNILLCMSV